LRVGLLLFWVTVYKQHCIIFHYF